MHKHRNLLAHAPERLHEEVSADYTDMIYAATPKEIETRPKAFIRKWRLRHRPVADCLEEAGDVFSLSRACRRRRANNERNRASARRVQAKDQDADCAAISRHRRHVVLGIARLWTDQHAQGRWMADARYKTHRSAN